MKLLSTSGTTRSGNLQQAAARLSNTHSYTHVQTNLNISQARTVTAVTVVKYAGLVQSSNGKKTAFMILSSLTTILS
jgi:hypothetical protein